jgi:hypothetical protein
VGLWFDGLNDGLCVLILAIERRFDCPLIGERVLSYSGGAHERDQVVSKVLYSP